MLEGKVWKELLKCLDNFLFDYTLLRNKNKICSFPISKYQGSNLQHRYGGRNNLQCNELYKEDGSIHQINRGKDKYQIFLSCFHIFLLLITYVTTLIISLLLFFMCLNHLACGSS